MIDLTPWGLTLLLGCHCCFVCNHWFGTGNIVYRSWNLASLYYCYHCHRHYHHNITEKYLLPWPCYLQVKFKYSEKAKKFWNNLPLIQEKNQAIHCFDFEWSIVLLNYFLTIKCPKRISILRKGIQHQISNLKHQLDFCFWDKIFF